MAVIVLSIPGAAEAHGLEVARADAPLPIELFLGGAVAVLAVSFAGVSRLWRRPRLQTGPRAERVEAKVAAFAYRAARRLGPLGLALVVVTGLGSGDFGIGGLSPVLVWIVAWLALPFASAVVGDIWTPLNPWRRLGEWLGLGGRERPELLDRWGVYPAVVLFTGFVWFEIVYPESGSGWALGAVSVAYTVAMAAIMVVAGRSTGLQMAEFLTTYHRVLSAHAPRGRSSSGRFVARGWLRALPVLPLWPGLAAFVIVMIASVSFDSLTGTLWWRDRLAALGVNAGEVWIGTVGLMAMIGLIGSGYWLACSLAAIVGRRPGDSPSAVAASFAHTLVPIGLAYAVAHYFTLVLFEGQLLLSSASDPFGLGWDLFGTASWRVVVWLPEAAVWWIQVIVILAGHVVAVVLAHDRALAVFPARTAVRSQYAMVIIMIVLTMLGLSLLAAG